MDRFPSPRSLLLAISLLVSLLVRAQRIDSVQVFRAIPPGKYTSAVANAMAWQMHRMNAPHTTIKGAELAATTEALNVYTPVRHVYRDLPGLTHLAMAFVHGRPLAFGVADDMDLLIDFTARTEYRISSFADHLKVRAVLAKALLMP
ncbi:MAG: hypothetical protein QM724_05275 [Flavobacteriales bacterium]